MIKLNLRTSWVIFGLGCGGFYFCFFGWCSFSASGVCTGKNSKLWKHLIFDAPKIQWCLWWYFWAVNTRLCSRVMKFGNPSEDVQTPLLKGSWNSTSGPHILIEDKVSEANQVLGRLQSIQSIFRETSKTHNSLRTCEKNRVTAPRVQWKVYNLDWNFNQQCNC